MEAKNGGQVSARVSQSTSDSSGGELVYHKWHRTVGPIKVLDGVPVRRSILVCRRCGLVSSVRINKKECGAKDK